MRFGVMAAALFLSACATSEALPSAAPAAAETIGAWTEIAPTPMRLDGRLYTPTCSHAPGADPAYRFWFHQGSGDGLVIFFDGGGACWDDVTCAVPRLASDARDDDGFYKAELIPTDNPNRFSGIFDLDNPRNPVRGWSIVYVPYCTGDVHTGANTAHYINPDTGAPYTIEHHGADNFRVILSWMRENLPQPTRLLVAGSSAGAYGASTHFVRIREAFPRGQALMLGDAGQGVATAAFLEKRDANWRYAAPRGLFARGETLTPESDVVARLAARYPGDRFAQYTTAHDLTQSGFYALMGVENACAAWTEAMTRDLARRQQAANFHSYLAAGQSHSILRSPDFYTQRSGGAPFAEWVAALLSGGGENRACEDCLRQAPPCRF
ncbi:MAG: pectin acetylesterase-family hydrolase [Hyphomonadaceae bacterium]